MRMPSSGSIAGVVNQIVMHDTRNRLLRKLRGQSAHVAMPNDHRRPGAPDHASGSVTGSPAKAADIQSLVAAVGMVVRSGMSIM
jgi:hypothetical protein